MTKTHPLIGFMMTALLSISCGPVAEKTTELDGAEILAKSMAYHDPNQNWNNAEIRIHIQEPRLNNPFRYSQVKLNLKDGHFELIRSRESHVSKHTIDPDGRSKVYLDNDENIAVEYVEKYKLDPDRNYGYRNFYTMLIGLPMTLNASAIDAIGPVESKRFNDKDCFMLPIELKDPVFTDRWNIFINRSTYAYEGMEILFPKDSLKGERLIFEGEISINQMKIPRIRHWYTYADNTFSGSDIILKELE